jgi:hypothetical protein
MITFATLHPSVPPERSSDVPEVQRTTSPSIADPFAVPAGPGPDDVTPERAKMLAHQDEDEPAGTGDVDTALVRRYKELREAEKAADAEKSAIKEEADALEGRLIEMFSDAGVPSISLDGKTIYLHRSTYAQRLPGVDTDDVKAALREAGAGDLIKESINANTLSAYVRELLDVDDAPGLPEPLQGILELGERFAVRVVEAGRRGRTSTKK